MTEKSPKNYQRLFVVLVMFAFLAGCAGAPAAKEAGPVVQAEKKTEPAKVLAPAAEAGKPIDLTILHVNDTHSKLEPTQVKLTVDISDSLKGKGVYVELGGFPRLRSAVEAIRKAEPNVLFLHAGDAFQGTLFFTQYLGKADADFLNLLKVDAMTLGNHEFDKGPTVLKSGLLDVASFPIVSSNVDYSAESILKDAKILPYAIKTVNGEKVGIIGVSFIDTPYISSPGKNIKFLDPKATVTKAVAELEKQGVNKIIVLSHEGFDLDLELAKAVKGVDVVVGGHSHTLVGDTSSLGLPSKYAYPTAVTTASGDTALVVQSWEWAKALGKLNVSFDAAGKIVKYTGSPKLLTGDSWGRIYDLPGAGGKTVRVEFKKNASGKWDVREYDGKGYNVDPPADRLASHMNALRALAAKYQNDGRFMLVKDDSEAAKKLASYAEGVNKLKAVIACEAAEELRRGNNMGPGPIIADGMLWKTGADVAVMNPGGVRTNVNPGKVTVAQVYELQPFGNTLVTLKTTGAELVKVFEDMSDFSITSYTDRTAETALIYVAGATFTLDTKAAKGSRVKDVMIGKPGAYASLDPAKEYSLVVNNFMATGGDKNTTLATLTAKQVDTGFVDSEVTLDYVKDKVLTNASEARVNQK